MEERERRNCCMNDWGYYMEEKSLWPTEPSPGMTLLHEVKSLLYGQQSHRNKDSQGTMITQTSNFPYEYDEITHEVWATHSDTCQMWDSDNYKKACEFIGDGEQHWKRAVLGKSDKILLKFAHLVLKTPTVPEHVRFIYWFNVSNGFDCPVIEAIIKKVEEN